MSLKSLEQRLLKEQFVTARVCEYSMVLTNMKGEVILQAYSELVNSEWFAPTGTDDNWNISSVETMDTATKAFIIGKSENLLDLMYDIHVENVVKREHDYEQYITFTEYAMSSLKRMFVYELEYPERYIMRKYPEEVSFFFKDEIEMFIEGYINEAEVLGCCMKAEYIDNIRKCKVIPDELYLVLSEAMCSCIEKSKIHSDASGLEDLITKWLENTPVDRELLLKNKASEVYNKILEYNKYLNKPDAIRY